MSFKSNTSFNSERLGDLNGEGKMDVTVFFFFVVVFFRDGKKLEPDICALTFFFRSCIGGTHRIHVWYIYLHLVDFDGKCR